MLSIERRLRGGETFTLGAKAPKRERERETKKETTKVSLRMVIWLQWSCNGGAHLVDGKLWKSMENELSKASVAVWH